MTIAQRTGDRWRDVVERKKEGYLESFWKLAHWRLAETCFEDSRTPPVESFSPLLLQAR